MSALIEHRLEFGEVGSTNDLARLYPQGTAIVAQSQTNGRGRRGQSWLSPAGSGIYLSVRLRLDPQLDCLAQRVAFACLRVTQNLGGQALYKWPNDLLDLNRGKFGGILIESLAAGDLIIGIGLNLSSPSPDFASFPSPKPDRERILSALFAELENCFLESSALVLAFCWAESVHKLYPHFTFLEAATPEPYTALGLNPDGSLLAQSQAGKEISLTLASGLRVLDS